MSNPVDYLGRTIEVGNLVVRAAVTGSQGTKNGSLETLTVTKVDGIRVYLAGSSTPIGGWCSEAQYRKYNSRLVVIG